jgi:3-hydroxyisobutyrate dehydrogenase
MRIGWIGTGVMGRSMAGHLLAAGHELHIHSRTRAKADELIDRGAVWHDRPADAARESAVVFTMLGFPADVRAVALGPAGVIAALPPGGILVDCTTSSPALAMELAESAAARGCCALDTPVSGGDVGARNAALSIMVGGDVAAFERVRPLLGSLGKTVVHHGPPGSGQHAKMVNQILIAAGMVAVCEGLLYARACGLDLDKVMASVGGGAAGSWSLANYGPRILRGDFEPGFYVEHFVKDMQIALEEADRMGLILPGLALAKTLYDKVVELGGSRKGTQALIKAIEALVGETDK